MAWAAAYALLEFLGRQEIGVIQMARIHGVLNGFAFGLCGLLAFRRNLWARLLYPRVKEAP